MKFRGVSGWRTGVAVIGIMLIAYISGLGVVADAASTTQGWQVRIGDQEPVNVNESDIDTVLFQGEFQLETRRVPPANLSARSVCVGFPKVKATRDIADDDDYSIVLRLDIEACQIVVDSVRRIDTPATMPSATSESHEEHRGSAIVRAAEVGGTGLGFALTHSNVMLDYASSLTVYNSSHTCSVQSPAAILGVTWHNDDCIASPITRHDTYLQTKTTGDYHATRNDELWDESIHSSSAEIKGYSTRYIITCEWSPSSIKDISFGPFSVNLQCEADPSG